MRRARGAKDLLVKRFQQEVTSRLDRNFSQNILDFAQFGDDEQLCRDLVVYFSYALQTPNLLNHGQLDPTHFGKVMHYDRANLFRTHAKPVDKPAPDKPFIWDSVLENALFRLSSQALAFSRALPSHNNRLEAFRLESVHILRNLTVYIDPRNRDKRYYRFQYNPEIIGNLSKSFATFNLETYNHLRQGKMNLQRLYLYLEGERTKLRLYNTRHEQKANTIEIDFNRLSHLTGKEGVAEVRKRKYRMKQMVAMLNQVAGWSFDFQFVTTTAQQNYPYTLAITFTDLEDLTETDRFAQRKKIFQESLERNLLDLFRSLYPDGTEYDYQAWKFQPKSQPTEKFQAYLDAQRFAFERPADAHDSSHHRQFEQLLGFPPLLANK